MVERSASSLLFPSATGRRDSGNQRSLDEGKSNGEKQWARKALSLPGIPRVKHDNRKKLVTTGNYLPTIKNYLPTIKKYLPTIHANYLENLRVLSGDIFVSQKNPSLTVAVSCLETRKSSKKTAIDASKWSLHHHFLSTDDIDSARECGGGGHHAPVDGIDGKEPASVLSP